MARLIANADDLGYTCGVNRAIVALHARGALSSATLMACGAAIDDALRRSAPALATGGRALPIGCHVVLVDGTPAAAAGSIPTLLEPSAALSSPPAFRATLGAFVADLERGRIREAEIETETIAQIRRLQACGVRVTHVDTHKHTHMFPRVLRPVLRAALQCGVSAIRNPFEPRWSRAATRGAPLLRRAEVRLLELLRPGFLKLVEQAGAATTSGALGILATGTLDALAIERLLRAALDREQAGETGTTWELVCHPGHYDAELASKRTRLLEAREREHAALIAALPLLKHFELIDFGSLGREQGGQ